MEHDKNIPSSTLNFLKKVKDEGHLIVIATGRSWKLCENYYNQLEINDPVISFNGAVISYMNGENFHIHLGEIERDIGEDIIKYSTNLGGFNIIAESIESLYIYNPNNIIEKMKNRLCAYTKEQYHEKLIFNPVSMLITAEKDILVKTIEYINQNYINSISYRRWRDSWKLIELTMKNINKIHAIEKVANHYGISKQNIIAFGDEENDIEMIAYAGVGVAMGNASEAVKEIADDITLSNENQGVAYYLQKYLSMPTLI